MQVPILKQRDYLIASIQAALTDADLLQLRDALVTRVGTFRSRRGIGVIARDAGPGIPDVERALQEGFSTSRSFGMGLSGVRRLVDEFKIVSELGSGTTVSVKKWK